MTKPHLPDFNQLVVARLVGASHHMGSPAFHREGWAFMARRGDPKHTVKDGWARDRYDAALKQIDADYADVKEWLYVRDLLKLANGARRLTEDEQAVIEAAIEWSDMRQAAHYGPAGKLVKRAERDLEKAIDNLHAEHDGRWQS